MADIDASRKPRTTSPTSRIARRFPPQGRASARLGDAQRLSKIFARRPAHGELAIDHGYFLGPTTGLERIDLTIVPLLQYADA